MIAEVSSIDRPVDGLPESAPVQVSVTWIDNGTDNGLWGIDPTEVTIDKKVGLIVYTLSEMSTPGVRFLPPPSSVVWISPPQPDNFVLDVSAAGRQLFIADTNQTQGDPQSFSFRLLAVYDNMTRISPDPTIINREPS